MPQRSSRSDGPARDEPGAPLRDVGYDGWAVVELDSVEGTGRSPQAAAANDKRYLESRGFTL